MASGTLDDYKKRGKLRQVSLCVIVDRGRVLLGMKKRSFGAGKWNGFGGKPSGNETIEETAVRETEEEVGITPTSLEKAAVLDFYFAGDDKDRDWNQQVIVFLVKKWTGEPRESEEMLPRWFDLGRLPFREMWEDDTYWLPDVLAGKRVRGHFLFDENQKMKEHETTELKG